MCVCAYRNLDSCDQRGRSAMHLIASSASVHAKKMASVLLRNGASAGERGCGLSLPMLCIDRL